MWPFPPRLSGHHAWPCLGPLWLLEQEAGGGQEGMRPPGPLGGLIQQEQQMSLLSRALERGLGPLWGSHAGLQASDPLSTLLGRQVPHGHRCPDVPVLRPLACHLVSW